MKLPHDPNSDQLVNVICRSTCSLKVLASLSSLRFFLLPLYCLPKVNLDRFHKE